jgi:hypothetical protein
VEYNPVKNKSQPHKLKFLMNPSAEKEAAMLGKTNLSDKSLESSRNVMRNNKRLNSLERFYGEEGIIGKKIDKSSEKIMEQNDFSTQT